MQLIVCSAIILLLCLFICVFVSKLQSIFTDERTEEVPGIKGASITVLNNLVLMSLIAQALFLIYCKS